MHTSNIKQTQQAVFTNLCAYKCVTITENETMNLRGSQRMQEGLEGGKRVNDVIIFKSQKCRKEIMIKKKFFNDMKVNVNF